jgi:hypothetical protein
MRFPKFSVNTGQHWTTSRTGKGVRPLVVERWAGNDVRSTLFHTGDTGVDIKYLSVEHTEVEIERFTPQKAYFKSHVTSEMLRSKLWFYHADTAHHWLASEEWDCLFRLKIAVQEYTHLQFPHRLRRGYDGIVPLSRRTPVGGPESCKSVQLLGLCQPVS